MNKIIKTFKQILPYEIHGTYTGLTDSNKYFYISVSQGPFTNHTCYIVLSRDILIKANTGEKRGKPFLNSIEVFRRQNMVWNELFKKSLSVTTFSYINLRSKTADLMINHFIKNNSDPILFTHENVVKMVEDLLNGVFRDQEENLLLLQLNESN